VFLPTGDAPNYSDRRPWMNWTLIAVNTAIYLWASTTYSGELAYQRFTTHWGFVPADPRIETFFSSMFMHGSLLHLGGNMLFLWVFGDNVEGRLGHVGYLLTYLACGLAAVLLFRAMDPTAGTPLVGASGAIFGVLGFYFLAFPRNRVRIFWWFFLIGVFWVAARVFIGVYFLIQLVYTLSQGQTGGGGVAYAAHVGGFLFGVGAALAFRLAAGPEAKLPQAAAGLGSSAGALLRQSTLALQQGHYRAARSALERILTHHPHAQEAPEAALRLGHLLSRLEERPEAAKAPLLLAARLHPDPARRAEAVQELLRLGHGTTTR
jgi:membrane associated rhomboid family serine protease